MVQFNETKPHLLRQAELVPSEILGTPITIIGAGAVGSFTTLTLAKMGFENLTVWDFDNIEIHNMNSQFYRFADIGKPKVFALRSLVEDFTKTKIKPVLGEYSGEQFEGVVISAVDSMKVRKLIWDSHKQKTLKCRFIIDPRMGAEVAHMYVARPFNAEDAERYEKTLYSDEEAVQERCTNKATMYTAIMLSGAVARTVRDVMTGTYTRSLQWEIRADDMITTRSDGHRSAEVNRDAEQSEESEERPRLRDIWDEQLARTVYRGDRIRPDAQTADASNNVPYVYRNNDIIGVVERVNVDHTALLPRTTVTIQMNSPYGLRNSFEFRLRNPVNLQPGEAITQEQFDELSRGELSRRRPMPDRVFINGDNLEGVSMESVRPGDVIMHGDVHMPRQSTAELMDMIRRSEDPIIRRDAREAIERREVNWNVMRDEYPQAGWAARDAELERRETASRTEAPTFVDDPAEASAITGPFEF